jgi:hypothetical protein
VPTKAKFHWKLGDEADADEHHVEMIKRIYVLRNARGSGLHDELAVIVEDLRELAAILDSTPKPTAFINVMPPVQDRSESRLPMVAGMSPAGIKDPEARKAYEEAIARNADKARIVGWLHTTAGYHRSMVRRLEWALDDLVLAGVMTRVGADEAVQRASGNQKLSNASKKSRE